MVPLQVDPMPPGELVALVNDWGAVPRRVGRRDAPPAPAAVAGRLRRPAELVEVADRVHAVFAAYDEAARVRLVNEMLAATGVRPVLREDGGAVRPGWTVPRAGDALLASAALSLRDHLAAHPERLGVCADDRCADVYVDASPGGHRRFCSLTCQNRARTAAFRRRRRAAGPDGP